MRHSRPHLIQLFAALVGFLFLLILFLQSNEPQADPGQASTETDDVNPTINETDEPELVYTRDPATAPSPPPSPAQEPDEDDEDEPEPSGPDPGPLPFPAPAPTPWDNVSLPVDLPEVLG